MALLVGIYRSWRVTRIWPMHMYMPRRDASEAASFGCLNAKVAGALCMCLLSKQRGQ